ncbi:MAG: zinc ribbon domain-containing protein [Microbacteriaceae bacterium]|nr:MAG: zinc ribbon domain-containing protein [Microbacteriaceae bacterium]
MNCRVCGSELPDGALFCGECGSSVTATPLLRSAAEDPRPSDTTIIEPLPGPAVSGPRSTIRSISIPTPIEQDPIAPPEGALSGPATDVPSAPAAGAPAAGAPAESAARAPDAAQSAFTLTASTGERIVVTGPGLLGRRPMAQPGEAFAQLVSIADTQRSVSKTHLEFGIDTGELWVCDRYSANGTVIRLPGGVPRICEPGRRYRVQRGARVDIGDQYLDVD